MLENTVYTKMLWKKNIIAIKKMKPASLLAEHCLRQVSGTSACMFGPDSCIFAGFGWGLDYTFLSLRAYSLQERAANLFSK